MIKFAMTWTLFLTLTFSCYAYPQGSPFTNEEIVQIKKLFLNNISTQPKTFERKNAPQTSSIAGAIIAAPSEGDSNFNMDYRLHWVRDAAIAMHEIVELYQRSNENEKKTLLPYINHYIAFETKAQEELLRKGEKNLGEPKFNIDGTLWEGKWARPQSDGPALRANTNIEIANLFFMSRNKLENWEKLIELINSDLDYIVHEWTRPTYDLWEELYANHHFFNKMVQRKALLAGSALLEKLNEHGKAISLKQEAIYLTDSLQAHWNNHAGFLVEAIDSQDMKGGGLNSAIILGLLYGKTGQNDDPLALDADVALSSIYFIRNIFSYLYKINIANPAQPPLIGRYPNDIYDGKDFKYGNPWFLTTISLAHFYYALAQTYLQKGYIQITKDNLGFHQQIMPGIVTHENIIHREKNSIAFFKIIFALEKAGDDYLSVIKKYSKCYDNSCLHLSEQIDRATGESVSAKDLTWSYASLLLALQAREDLAKSLAKIQIPRPPLRIGHNISIKKKPKIMISKTKKEKRLVAVNKSNKAVSKSNKKAKAH